MAPQRPGGIFPVVFCPAKHTIAARKGKMMNKRSNNHAYRYYYGLTYYRVKA